MNNSSIDLDVISLVLKDMYISHPNRLYSYPDCLEISEIEMIRFRFKEFFYKIDDEVRLKFIHVKRILVPFFPFRTNSKSLIF